MDTLYGRIQYTRGGRVLIIATVLFITALSYGSSKGDNGYKFRLSKAGYAPDSNLMLVVVKASMASPDKEMLFVFNLDSGVIECVNGVQGPIFDFGWMPGRDQFVVLRSSTIPVFHRDHSSNTYTGVPLKCPVDALYLKSSWSPDGNWLAVVCHDYSGSGIVAGIYSMPDDQFKMTSIELDSSRLVWENNETLYALRGNDLLELRLKDGGLEVVSTVTKYDSALAFHGIIHGKAVVETYEDVMFGRDTLFHVGRPEGCGVTLTKDIVLIATESILIAFDHNGLEIARVNPGRVVSLGPADLKNGQVFGVSESILLSIQVSEEGISLYEKMDLSEGQLSSMEKVR